jgi:hypothetical protein
MDFYTDSQGQRETNRALFPPDWENRLFVLAVFGGKFSQIGGMNTSKKLMFVASNSGIFLMMPIFANCHILASSAITNCTKKSQIRNSGGAMCVIYRLC